MSELITIQFWNDLICPMCPIGNVKLKQGIERFAHKDKVEIVYRSFRLRPGVSPHTVNEYLEGNHGKDTDVPAILAQVERMGAEAGLIYKMENTLAGDTMDAHRIVQFAKPEGIQKQTVERIYTAHFAGEANIFDKDTLVRLASEVGLDRNAVTSMLAGDAFKQEVEADEKTVRQMGIGGVPFFLLNDQIPVRGIQSPEHFLLTLNQAWQAK
jgi:predicted DsbA family dithiol-disulfide isomerase